MPAQVSRQSTAASRKAGGAYPEPAPIGENLARVRRARGLTQEGLAGLAGVSVDVIARLEQGRKQTARWRTLNALAAALDIELSTLVTPGSGLQSRNQAPEPGRLLHVRDAITSLGQIPGLELADSEEVAPLPQLETAMRAAWQAYQAGQFTFVANLLPTLIGDASRAARAAVGDDTARAHSVLATACHMAAGVCVTLGHEDLAFFAVERGAAVARHADSDLPALASAIFASWILLKQGRYAEAERVAVTAAQRAEPSFATATRQGLATFGNLLVNASAAAVRGGNPDRATELLDVAAGAAVRHGRDSISQWSVFGPHVVAITRVNNAVEVGEFDTAARLASNTPELATGACVPASWLARYDINVAYASLELGDDAEAVDALMRARGSAPEWVTYHPLARGVVGELLERVPRRASARLRDLADHFGVV